MEPLAYNIHYYRTQHNLTQQQLADKLSLSRSVIGKWEKGLAVPDAAALLKMSKLFNITADHLLGKQLYEEEILKDYQQLYHSKSDEIDENMLHVIHYLATHPEYKELLVQVKELPAKKQLALQKLLAQLIDFGS